MKPVFFESAAALRAWLAKNHALPEAWIGFFKKSSGRRSITYFEALDEALCFGWIDGVRKSLDDERFVQRFTPRRAKSTWSLVNVRRVKELRKAGRMAPPGLQAFEGRDPSRTGLYSFEQRAAPRFDAASTKAFRANARAWDFFQKQPPGYRRLATFYVMSAKKEETRARRLARLIADSQECRRIGILAKPGKKKGA